MTVDLYYMPPSSPSRAVQMLAETIGLPLNLKLVDLRAREQYSPEFLRMNPAHAVPTIDDAGFYVSESRAILTYLVDKYAPGSALYPAQADRRALINQRLQFDLGTLYRAFAEYYFKQLFFGADADPVLYSRIARALDVLETFLGRSTYAAGDVYTIADISLLATVSSFCHEDGVQLVEARWPNVCGWYERARAETKGWHWNEVGLTVYRSFFAALKSKRAVESQVVVVAADAATKVEESAVEVVTAEPVAVVAESVLEETSEPVAVVVESVVEKISEPIAVVPETIVEEIIEPVAVVAENVAEEVREPVAVVAESVVEKVSDPEVIVAADIATEVVTEQVAVAAESVVKVESELVASEVTATAESAAVSSEVVVGVEAAASPDVVVELTKPTTIAAKADE